MAKEIAQMTEEEQGIFRAGFVAGWCKSVGNDDKGKLKEIAVAAADKYINTCKKISD